jgi:aminopeptidase N
VSDADLEQRANVVLHELAHMWFGNLVTTRWWDDTWLNEAFATYAAAYAQVATSRNTDAWARFAQEAKSGALLADQLPTTHPIAADVSDLQTALANFDSITYSKGASVLRQLVAYVGEDAFFLALQSYFREHRFGNAELADLLRALETSSGRKLGTWCDQWLSTPSVNILRPSFDVGTDGALGSFAVEQDGLPGHPTLRTHRIAIGMYREREGRLERVRRVEVDVSGARTEVPELLGLPAPQLVIVNDDDLTYAKLRFDPASLAVLRSGIGRIQSPVTRALCWTALWDMTRDGEVTATGYVDLVLHGVGAETAPSLVSGLLENVEQAVHDYVFPARVPEAAQRLADAAWDGISSAPAASDSQLVWSRCFARVAGITSHAGRLRGLYDGELIQAGVDLDFETRWSILQGLVPHGLADEADIGTEFEREPSFTAEERAAKVVAMIPSASVKNRVWDEITATGGISQPIRTAKAEGFWAPRQEHLLQGFVARYFDDLQRFWDLDGGGHQSSMLTRALFPRVIDESTLSQADAWLEATTGRPTQRRTVLERRDELFRALRNRGVDR